MKTVTFLVNQRNQAKHQEVESKLLDIEGVERALIDMSDGDIKVEYHDEMIDMSKVKAVIEAFGAEIREVRY